MGWRSDSVKIYDGPDIATDSERSPYVGHSVILDFGDELRISMGYERWPNPVADHNRDYNWIQSPFSFATHTSQKYFAVRHISCFNLASTISVMH